MCMPHVVLCHGVCYTYLGKPAWGSLPHTATTQNYFLRKAGCSTFMNAQEVVQQARTNSLRLVRFFYCDNGGVIPGKTTHTSKLASRTRQRIGQSLAMPACTTVEALL